MADFEGRLTAIEQRLAMDFEAMHNLHGRSNAYRHIFEAIATPICATIPAILPNIIQNLKNYESEAQRQNSQAMMVAELRYAREYFESLALRIRSDSSSKHAGAPRRGK
jgi:hypothetical protein